ncbi:MAG: hypothetical protein JNM80_10020 [Phycisphaerae bacterium]|nr:hypothetical protein [Phycisphaerae bacterium]
MPNGTLSHWGASYLGVEAVPAPDPEHRFEIIEVGHQWAMALQDDGQIKTWGVNDWGQRTLPAGANDYIAIAAGEYHGLALRRSDLKLAYWGDPRFGLPEGAAAAAASPRAFSAGGYHDALIRSNGTISVWGSWSSSPIVAISSYTDPTLNPNLDPSGSGNPNAEEYIAISSGHFHLLAIRNDGKLRAWGSNLQGQGGTPGRPSFSRPTPSSPSRPGTTTASP